LSYLTFRSKWLIVEEFMHPGVVLTALLGDLGE